MFLRVKWLKNSIKLESTGKMGRTSLLEDDLADVLEKYGWVLVERPPTKEKPPKVEKAVVTKTRKR